MKPAIQPTTSQVCPRPWRWIVLILFVLHMSAVVAEPLRFFSQSEFQAGPEFMAIRRWTAPYVEWLYLDHGYFFFAPNPGPSHLIAVSKETPPQEGSSPVSGSAPAEGVQLERYAAVFPDRRHQQPRLLYHRYFMLSEFYNNSFAPDRLLPVDLADAEFVARWKQDRSRYERLQTSIGDSLAKDLGTQRVRLHRLERILLTPDQVLRQGWRLDDPRTLAVLEEGPEPPLPPDVAAPPVLTSPAGTPKREEPPR